MLLSTYAITAPLHCLTALNSLTVIFALLTSEPVSSTEQTLGLATEVSQTLVKKIWNSLPPALRQPGLSFAVFKQHLKFHWFNSI